MPTTATASPIEITIDPSAVKVPANYGTYHGHLTLTNDSHTAITVSPVLLRMSTKSACTQPPPTWLSFSGKPFGLAAGRARTMAYTVHATHGTDGSAAIVFSATSGKAADKFGGAVGMRITVGSGQQVCTKPVSAPASHTSGLSSDQVIGLAVLAVLVVCIVTLIVRTRVRRSR